MNDLTHEVLDVDDLELAVRWPFMLIALLLVPMLSLTTITNFNECLRVGRMRRCEYMMQVIKAESGEGSEASEVSKTSEVKVEDSTKDNPETVLIDEDQRKLFVGGLAQVF